MAPVKILENGLRSCESELSTEGQIRDYQDEAWCTESREEETIISWTDCCLIRIALKAGELHLTASVMKTHGEQA